MHSPQSLSSRHFDPYVIRGASGDASNYYANKKVMDLPLFYPSLTGDVISAIERKGKGPLGPLKYY